jgi:hypothetical protein
VTCEENIPPVHVKPVLISMVDIHAYTLLLPKNNFSQRIDTNISTLAISNAYIIKKLTKIRGDMLYE